MLIKAKSNIIANICIRVIDLETYNNNKKAKVYAIGFKTNLNIKLSLYYIDKKSLNSSEIIVYCIKKMLWLKYKDVTFYVYNLSMFNIVFIIKTFLEYNGINISKHYKLETIYRDNIILN